MLDINQEEHPSFGLLRISKVHSAKEQPFNGSPVSTFDYLTITISPASRSYLFSEERFNSVKVPYLSLRLTYSQLMEALLKSDSLGVPITMQSLGGVKVDDPPIIERTDVHKQQFDSVMNDFSDSLKKITEDMEELSKSSQISKVKFNDLHRKVNILKDNFMANINFSYNRFNEYMHNSLSAMKNEFYNFMSFNLNSKNQIVEEKAKDKIIDIN